MVVPRTFDDTIARCFFAVVWAMACLMPMQNDTWWHLRAGQEMWTRGTILLRDEFSFTAPGAHWPNHEWLSEILFYAIYRVGGLPGLTLFAASAFTLALGLSWRLMAGGAADRLLITGLAMTAIVPVWTVRPHVFTFLFLMVTFHLVRRERYRIVPFLFILWANLHGGVALGLVLLAGATLARAYLHGWSGARPLIIVTALSFAATCLTPLGVSLWLEIPESIHRSSINRIVEWQSPTVFEPTYAAFWAIAALFLVTTWVFRRSIASDRHAAVVACALAVLPLALRARRNVPPFLLLAIPALTNNVAHWLERRPAQRKTAEHPLLNAVFFTGCVIVSAATVVSAWSRSAPRLQWQPLPSAVAREVEACGERIYNTYPDGGYLIWFAPRARVFIDSRQDPYPIPFVQEYVRLEQTGDYRATFEKYGVQCALLSPSSLVAKRLQADGWKTRMRDSAWIVLESPHAQAGVPASALRTDDRGTTQ